MKPYGEKWPAFSRQIRFVRALSQCECCGTCGLHRGRRCCELHHSMAHWAQGTVRLTVAHLCQCSPPCHNPDHVLAMCQRCHLRTDRYKHAQARLRRARKPEVQSPAAS